MELYFVKRNETRADLGVFDKNNLFLYENATEKQLVDILNAEKPIQRNIDYTKVAKISTERWDSFLSWKPDAYVTRISIEQFLGMTTESYVDQRQINALANQYAKNATVEDIKNSYKDAIYLEIDFDQGKVTDHNGRHRLTQLLNAGNGYADVFVIAKGKTDFESKNSVEIKGQFNDNVYRLGLIRANNKQFAKAIEATFRKEDSNIRYSRRLTKDSKGRELTPEQAEFFKDSKAVDKDGKLVVVYHGTEGKFYVFDKALRGKNTWMDDSQKGFFFTNRKTVARGYALTAQINKCSNMVWRFTNGSFEGDKLIRYLLNNDYTKLIATEEGIRKFEEIIDLKSRIANRDQDIMELYLNIENPLVEEWDDPAYDHVRMTTAITKALLGGHDGVIIRKIDDTIQAPPMISDIFIVFEPNQIKSVNNKKPTFDEDIRYSRRGNGSKYQPREVSQITREEYEHHAWATANKILTQNESGNFIKKIGEKKLGSQFAQTADGLYMIPVGENGIENKVVYTDGDWESPSVEKVVEIKLADEISLDIVRGFIYESKGIVDAHYFDGLLAIYDATSFQYGTQRNGSRQNSGVNQRISDGRGTDSEIRRSRRVIYNREDISNALGDALEMMSVFGDAGDKTIDLKIENRQKVLDDFVAKINDKAVG